MKVLLVGAGAVGQVFGHRLQQGGAEVAFLTKDKYARAAREGFSLYPLARRDPRAAPVRFEGFGVLTSTDEVAAETWDAVWLCVSTTALQAGTWLEELAAATGDATVVGLQPGLEDPPLVRRLFGEHRVVWGIIELIAYHGPIPGESLPEPGVAYWIPRWLMFPFSGPEGRTRATVEAFRAGGLRATVAKDVVQTTALGGPVLNLHMAALEAAGWSFAEIKRDRALLRLTSEAVRQAVAVAAHQIGGSVPLWVRLMRPWMVRLVATLAPMLMPLDIETYLQVHFTKVHDQTVHQLDRWIALARAAGLPHDKLEALAATRTAPDALGVPA